ncbi:MAG: hypothetical protein A3F78_06950 [Burkholderiales bacterium RIFCSPLOWO2_12_FULL_61_40]|nr:MAG: hypothetical protein A3F78_06950 [Burkholderiales bacterium RIFCSPLOWO2_12_FULL_61_40]
MVRGAVVRTWTWALLVLIPCGVWAQDVLPVPPLSAHVMDSTATLSRAQLQALDTKLQAFEASSGTQVVVLILPTTQPEDIASYANRVANAWKIGRKEVGDGLLLIVAKNDRQLRIEVAKTLEGAIPDLAAKRVIDQAITPQFRQGDFAGGLEQGVNQIMALIQGEALPAPRTGPGGHRGNSGFQWMDLAVFLFFAVAVGGSIAQRLFGTRLGAVLTGGAAGVVVAVLTSSVVVGALAALVALVLALLFRLGRGLPSSGRNGWGGGGLGGGGWGGPSGGGGFRSGGGGDFGGGGASGRW